MKISLSAFLMSAIVSIFGCSRIYSPGISQMDPSGCLAAECHISTPLMQILPVSGSHTAHLESNAGIGCNSCHDNYGSNLLHKNGIINGYNAFTENDAPGGIVFFDSSVNPGATWNNSANTCSGMTCHGTVGWYTMGGLSCILCHYSGSPIDPMAVGKHAAHIYTGHGIIDDINCETCHNNYKGEGTHNDGTLDSDGIVSFGTTYTGTWTNASSTCSGMTCHGDATWSDIATLSCDDCHSTTYSAYYPDPVGTAQGKHTEHLNTAHNIINDIECETCHNNYTGQANHINGVSNTNNMVYFGSTYTGTWSNMSNSCSSMACHGNAVWSSTATLSCDDCHSAAYSTYNPDPVGTAQGKHPDHVNTAHNTININCETCHYDYGGQVTHLNGTMNSTSTVYFGIVYAGTWTNATDTCSGLTCHDNGVWNTSAVLSCDGCHTSAYSTYFPDPYGEDQGRHVSHIDDHSCQCTYCHKDYKGLGTHINGTDDLNNDAVTIVYFDDAIDHDFIFNDTVESCTKTGDSTGCHDNGSPGWNSKLW